MRGLIWALVFCNVCLAQEIKVRVINGQDGQPIPKQGVLVHFLTLSQGPTEASSPLWLETDTKGEARFAIPKPVPDRVSVRVRLSSDWYCNCSVIADTKTVIQHGVTEPPPAGTATETTVIPVAVAGAIVIAARTWKEYVYHNEGFAIAFPQDPNPHADPYMANMTAYTVHLSSLDGLTLRVSSEQRDCATTLRKLKEEGKPSHMIAGSMKDVSIGGHPGIEWEYEQEGNETLKRYERYICADGRFYIFAVMWMGTQDLPREFAHIVSSFRFLPPATKQKP